MERILPGSLSRFQNRLIDLQQGQGPRGRQRNHAQRFGVLQHVAGVGGPRSSASLQTGPAVVMTRPYPSGNRVPPLNNQVAFGLVAATPPAAHDSIVGHSGTRTCDSPVRPRPGRRVYIAPRRNSPQTRAPVISTAQRRAEIPAPNGNRIQEPTARPSIVVVTRRTAPKGTLSYDTPSPQESGERRRCADVTAILRRDDADRRVWRRHNAKRLRT